MTAAAAAPPADPRDPRLEHALQLAADGARVRVHAAGAGDHRRLQRQLAAIPEALRRRIALSYRCVDARVAHLRGVHAKSWREPHE